MDGVNMTGGDRNEEVFIRIRFLYDNSYWLDFVWNEKLKTNRIQRIMMIIPT